MQLKLSHLIFQVILPVHLVVGYIKVVIGVVVFKHTAGDRGGRQRNQSPSYPVFETFVEYVESFKSMFF